MYLTILNYGEKNEVLTCELPSYAVNFQCEDFEEFITFNLNINISNCDWIVHEELPEMITVANTCENE